MWILDISSKEWIPHHSLHLQLFQLDFTFPLCGLKLMNQECLQEVIVHLVLSSWMYMSCFEYCSMPPKVFGLIDRSRCKSAAATLWNSLIAFIHDFHCKYLLFVHKLHWHRIPRLSISLRFQCRQTMTIIYIWAGWTTMFWNFLGWFQDTCFVTPYIR